MVSSSAVRLCAVGDIALGGSLQFPSQWSIEEYGNPHLLALLRRCEITFANLDCTFDCSGIPPHPDEYLVSAPVEQLDLIAALGMDVVSQANNHSMDYGGDSLAITRAGLRRRNVATVGTGGNLAEAGSPVIIERKGTKVGVLAYASTHHWVGAYAAGLASPGVAPLEIQEVEGAVKELAGEVDCVVVSMHWGKEFLSYPPPENVSVAHRIVDAGAKIVLGHHPHVVQGIENYQDGVICYSLGNFVFPDYPDQGLFFEGQNHDSILAVFKIEGQSVEVSEIVPCRFSGQRIDQLSPEEATKFLAKLEELSAAISQADYSTFWSRQLKVHELARIKRVFRDQVIRAGWKNGAKRIITVGRKNLRSIGRSIDEILFSSRPSG
jgi:hypothetical protein